MKKIIYLICFLPLFAKGQTNVGLFNKILVKDSITSFTNNTNLLLKGRGTGKIKLNENAYNIVIAGDSNLVGVIQKYAPDGYTVGNSGANRVVTDNGDGTGTAESDLTFVAKTLDINGELVADTVSFGTANKSSIIASNPTATRVYTLPDAKANVDILLVSGTGAKDNRILTLDSANNRANWEKRVSIIGSNLDVSGEVIADTSSIGNIRLLGNTISSTNTNGDITIDPNGTGDVLFSLDGGTVTLDDTRSISNLRQVSATSSITSDNGNSLGRISGSGFETEILGTTTSNANVADIKATIKAADDTGSNAIMQFSVQRSGGAAVTTRPLFAWYNVTPTNKLLEVSPTNVWNYQGGSISNVTLTAPKFATSGRIDDASGNELITFPATVSSAVNNIQISNAQTGNRPILEAVGSDTNVGTEYKTKGSGSHFFNGNSGVVKIGDSDVGTAQTGGMLALGDDLSSSRNVGIFRGTSTGAYSGGNYLNIGGFDGVNITYGNFELGSQTVGFTLNPSGQLDVLGVYTETTASGANVFVDTDGSLRRSTSSLKYKKDIETLSIPDSTFLKLRPVKFASVSDTTENPTKYFGYIAEEVDSIGLKELVIYKNNEPEALHYSQFTSLNTLMIQRLMAKIEELEARIEALEAQ